MKRAVTKITFPILGLKASRSDAEKTANSKDDAMNCRPQAGRLGGREQLANPASSPGRGEV